MPLPGDVSNFQHIAGSLEVWKFGCLDAWMLGCLGVWMFGSLDAWKLAPSIIWLFITVGRGLLKNLQVYDQKLQKLHMTVVDE